MPATTLAKPDTVPYVPEPRIYRIIRFWFNGQPRTIRKNVSLTEAQNHCRQADTHGTSRGVRWFDGYDYIPGCAPREGE